MDNESSKYLYKNIKSIENNSKSLNNRGYSVNKTLIAVIFDGKEGVLNTYNQDGKNDHEKRKNEIDSLINKFISRITGQKDD